MIPRLSPVSPRFGAWNSDLSRLTPGKGWDQPPVILQESKSFPGVGRDEYHATAVHEVGHLLATISTGLLKYIDVVQAKGLKGMVLWRNHPDFAVERRTVEHWINMAINDRAGYLAETLVMGIFPTSWSISWDYRLLQFHIRFARRRIAKIADKNRRQIGEAMLNRFLKDCRSITQAHLQQYDRELVEELALRLMYDKIWHRDMHWWQFFNRHNLDYIVWKYDLENVPSLAQDTVPPENRLEDSNERSKK